MGKAKWWCLSAVLLILVGCGIFGGVMMAFDWDFLKLSTDKLEEKTYNISGDYRDICVVTGEADVVFVPAEDGNTSVVCYADVNAEHSATVRNNTLYIELTNSRAWHEWIGIRIKKQQIIVMLPPGTYGNLQVEGATGDVELPKDYSFENVQITLSTGDIRVEGISAAAMKLALTTGDVSVNNTACLQDVSIRVTTGDTKLTALTCKALTTQGTTGDAFLQDVLVQQKLSITLSTGDVRFESCDAGELFVKNGTGDVTGSLLSDKVFVAKTNTGKVKVPPTATGGRCEITTTTGDIKITVEQQA